MKAIRDGDKWVTNKDVHCSVIYNYNKLTS